MPKDWQELSHNIKEERRGIMARISINEAYNHFATTYVAKENANVDKHKKSELQNVYKSIAKINKNSPLHVLQQDDNAQAEAVGIKEHARFLKSQLESLGSSESAGLDKRSAVSSDPEKVSVEYVGSGQSASPEFTLSVDRLATNQINAGHFLADEEVSLTPGAYSFNIAVGKHDYEFQYSIKDGDTNKDIQSKLSRLINKAGIGLVAGLQEDSEGRSTLIIGSTDTGLKPGSTLRFEITESSGASTGSVAYFGLNLIAQEPSNAHFYINGNEHYSSSNRFTVGNAYDITLKAGTAPDAPVTIGVKNKSDTLVENVTTLVDGYNNFIDSLNDVQSAGYKSHKLTGETIAIARSNLKATSEFGISLTEDGHISCDSQLMKDKFLSGTGQEVLNPLMHLAKDLIAKADEISIDPMKYVERPVFNYKDPNGTDNPSPYITSEYSGMMFNNYC